MRIVKRPRCGKPRISIPRVLTAFMVAMFLFACGPIYAGLEQGATHESDTQFLLEFIGFEIDPRLETSEARRSKEGLQIIYDGRGFRNGMPKSIFDFANQLRPTKTAKEAFLDEGTIPSPPSRPLGLADQALPLAESLMEREGSLLATRNCFDCHAGANAGMAIAGMGNSHLDQVYAYSNYKKLAKFEPVLTALSEYRIHWEGEAERGRIELENIFYLLNEVLLPTFKYARSRGDNMGPYAVWAYASRIKDAKTEGLKVLPRGETSQYTELLGMEELPTVDPNPWWHRKYKQSSYRYGEYSVHRSAHFALNFTNPHDEVNETHRGHVRDIDTILKFADQTQSPAYPHRIDEQLEREGAAYYHGEKPLQNGKTLNCQKCHGRYLKTGPWGEVGHWRVDYKEEGVKNVGTDKKYNEFLRRMKRIADRTLELSEYPGFEGGDEIIPLAEVPAKKGYLPGPLVGAWISAPYFHNGSVPTIEQVLNSKKRAKVWKRNSSPMEYDFEGLGLKHETLEMSRADYRVQQKTLGAEASPQGSRFRAIYHTEMFGRSKRGHRFGDRMNDEERKAVIEFIKSLSGPNMEPMGRPRT